MKARCREYVDAVQWDGADDEAQRLGLLRLRVVHAPDAYAWHFPTDNGPCIVIAGDWLVTHADGSRDAVRRIDFIKRYELL